MTIAGLPEEEYFCWGHRACAGCGSAIAMRLITKAAGKNSILVEPTGCMEVVSTPYPETAWKLPWIHGAFENAAPIASGVSEALEFLGKKDVNVVVIGGDGACYSNDTEILSEEGFKRVKDMKVGEKLWSVNLETNELELAKIEKVHRYYHNGKMIRAKSRYIDFLVTPNHNFPAKFKNEWRFIKARELKTRYKTRTIRSFNWNGKNPNPGVVKLEQIPKKTSQKTYTEFPLEPWLRFLAWYISEGSLYHSNSGYLIRIYQSNKKRRKEILKLLKELGLSPFECSRSVDFQSKQIYHYLKENCGKGSKDRKIPRWVLDLDKKYLKIVFETLIKGDGSVSYSKTPNRKIPHTTHLTISKELMSNVVELILKLGMSCTVSERDSGVYSINLNSTHLDHILYTFRKDLNLQQIFEEEYEGFVYCPQLEKNHTVIIKRNGKISLNGNSYDIGFGHLSGAFERGHDFTYVCYDNEAYMNCLTKDALIMTENGLREITEIKKGDKLHAFDLKAHDLVLLECAGVYDNGIKKVFEVETLHHSLKATGNHPFLVVKHNGRGKENRLIWKKVEELKKGDGVVVFREDHKVNKVNEINEHFAIEKIKEIKKLDSEPTLDLQVKKEHNFIANGYVVHNTGIQRSGSTPYAASTTTSPAGKLAIGKEEWKKDIIHALAAHGSPYLASASIGYPQDAFRKLKTAIKTKGPTFVNLLSPCPTGWRFPTSKSIEIAKLAVLTGLVPLYEIINGKHKVNQPKSIEKLKPVEDYLKMQRRYKHLFKPTRKEKEIKFIQERVKNNLQLLLNLAEKGF